MHKVHKFKFAKDTQNFYSYIQFAYAHISTIYKHTKYSQFTNTQNTVNLQTHKIQSIYKHSKYSQFTNTQNTENLILYVSESAI